MWLDHLLSRENASAGACPKRLAFSKALEDKALRSAVAICYCTGAKRGEKIMEILSFFKEIIKSDNNIKVGLSQFKTQAEPVVMPSPARVKTEVKLSDLMRNRSLEV